MVDATFAKFSINPPFPLLVTLQAQVTLIAVRIREIVIFSGIFGAKVENRLFFHATVHLKICFTDFDVKNLMLSIILKLDL
jgi:hypothetical protein